LLSAELLLDGLHDFWLSGRVRVGEPWPRGQCVTLPEPGPGPGPLPPCSDPRCKPSTDDSAWRELDLPHDFVVEGNFSSTADMSHGYLPLASAGIASTSPSLQSAAALAAVHVHRRRRRAGRPSTLWLNGYGIGAHASGYAAARYFLNSSIVNFGADNLLAVRGRCDSPDGW